MKLKTYIAISVHLPKVPKEHVAPNGGRQFCILVRTSSKSRLRQIIGGRMSLRHLNEFCGCHEANDSIGYERRAVADIVKKDHVIYYEHKGDWHEYNDGGAE